MNTEMINMIKRFLDYDSENQYLEFKEEEYKLGNYYKKHELLKDISAMANHPSNEDKYIIIGVVEAKGQAVGFKSITKTVDEANYQQFINEYLEPSIKFEYIPFEYKGFSLTYFRIYNNSSRPYLLKKDFRNAADHRKIEYREGDGFIRKGTTIKKITREDLEEVYTNRFVLKDRKSDIEVSPIILKSDDELLSEYNLSCIDIKIENKSNKSIGLDEIELIIDKTNDLTVITKTEARKSIKKLEQDKDEFTGPFKFNIPTIETEIDFFGDDVVEEGNRYIITKGKLRTETYVLTLPQKGIRDSIFNKSIIIIADKETYTLDVEVIIRSDDFTEGTFRKKFKLKIEPIE